MTKTLCITTPQVKKEAPKILEKYSAGYDLITAGQIMSNLTQELRQIRRKKYDTVIFLTPDIQLQRQKDLLKGLLLLAGARAKFFIDTFGNTEKVSWLTFLVKDSPKLILESLLSMILILYIQIKLRMVLVTAKKENKTRLNTITKIAYLRTDHWFGANKAGGSVGHTAGVANAFHELGYELFFISTYTLELLNEKIQVYLTRPSYSLFCNLPEVPEMAYNLKLIKAAERIFLAEKPNLIYQRYSLNNYSGIMLARKFNIPFIIEYNGSFVWMGKHWGRALTFGKVAETIEIANLHAADLIVVVSKPMKDELIGRGIEERKILVNPNGVNPERYSPELDGSTIRKEYNLVDNIVIGFIGTFGHWHGADVLAEAVKHVVQSNPNVHFLFIGDGLLMPKVKRIIKRDKVESFATFTGLIPQVKAPEYLAACDILASPHVSNPDGTPFFGSPTKLFEYMAMGKGIVASDLDQIGEVLKHNHNAILVEPGNVDQLVQGLFTLAEDKDLRERLGKQAREDVIRNYTWEKNAERVMRAVAGLNNERLE